MELAEQVLPLGQSLPPIAQNWYFTMVLRAPAGGHVAWHDTSVYVVVSVNALIVPVPQQISMGGQSDVLPQCTVVPEHPLPFPHVAVCAVRTPPAMQQL